MRRLPCSLIVPYRIESFLIMAADLGAAEKREG
jgi:hypothetical protein